MDLTTELHLAAGLMALVLGGGSLLREPRRSRNRLFALLSAALALWNLGVAGDKIFRAVHAYWHPVYLLGSCASAPLGLHFALTLSGRSERIRRRLLAPAYALALALWVTVFTPLYAVRLAWNLTALAILGGILLLALGVLVGQFLAVRSGPERDALGLLILGAVAVVLGGLSDFIPRDPSLFPRIGPVALLFFLLVISSIVIRQRFLDVDVFLARAVALLAGAAAATLLLYGVARISGEHLLPLFVATLLVLFVAGPAGKVLLEGARTLLGPNDTMARVLTAVSHRLPLAQERSQVWEILEEGRRTLPDTLRVIAYVRREPEESFRLFYRAGGGLPPPQIPADAPLAAILAADRTPLTRRFLEEEARESRGDRRRLAHQALRQARDLDSELLVPLMRGERLSGWIAIGGALPGQYLTAGVATALLAVGQQTLASLERIEAQETARRRETLATVGEMAAGLAHEVRNPLGAIQGAAEVLASEQDPSRTREMLEVIQEESARLGRVVGEFLDYARPGFPRREAVRLDALAGKCLQAMRLSGPSIRAEVNVDPGSPPALGDPDQLQRAFMNLIQNAREAAGAGGALRLDIAPAGPDRVLIRFEDDGPGIPPEMIPRLFKPFATNRPGGTGLGLALVHRVVEAHGGEIRVDGRPGIGAAFTLLLPAARELP